MPDGLIGVAISAARASEGLEKISQAEKLGISAAWLTSGGGGGEAVAMLAAAAVDTDTIMLGTSIVQTWSRHPVALAQQAQVVAELAPGRFRLGIGPSHKAPMESVFGADFRAPLGHLSEYIDIVKPLIQQAGIEYEGRWYSANANIGGPLNVPVMTSALRPGAFELAGSKADGVISWVCPYFYLRDTAMPALKEGARKAGRDTPPMVVHAPLCVTEDIEAAREGVRRRLGYFPASPFYANMFVEAGFAPSPDKGWTDEMLDAVLISGDEDTVAARIQDIFDWGGAEILASIVPAGDEGAASERRSLELLGKLASS
ncbi:MAG: LLM class flavin-dependent oxidoreductase [SAR202 cluster bacterium]|nr:LLM class flavin-dependent oxidoreductase [SAR202 cluster bacterium]MDP6716451.1 LLM class flavin-dependent oxidoreductase [SAR202 cluster bacterium]